MRSDPANRNALLRFVPTPALAVGLLLVILHPASATNRIVTNLNDSGAESLRDTIAASVDGDTIEFAVLGTISLTSGEIVIARDITINGPGPSALAIQRSAAADTPDFRIFKISDGNTFGPTVTISGVTIKNGRVGGTTLTDGGGAIFNDHSILVMNNCVLTSNHAVGTSGGRPRWRHHQLPPYG